MLLNYLVFCHEKCRIIIPTALLAVDAQVERLRLRELLQ